MGVLLLVAVTRELVVDGLREGGKGKVGGRAERLLRQACALSLSQ